jgi:Flp pilus assembly protein TadD
VFDKGVALMQQGIGNLRRPTDANLHLGIAMLRAGQKGRAGQAFSKVAGADGAADLARLWAKLP